MFHKFLNSVSYVVTHYVVMGVILAIVAYMSYLQIDSLMYMKQPISNIFMSSVIVPDFDVGENPEVQYNRNINTSFLGDFSVELKKVDDGTTICYGEGHGIKYTQGEPLRKEDTDFDWYIGNHCSNNPLLTAGQYYLETTYTIHIEGYPDRFLTIRSNVFTVT